jgi:predicted  nucleic acid-binding Zn-ribbon protein
MASSNPSKADERTSKFLETLFQNVAVNQTDVERKILSIKTEINKLKERRKKAKAALKAKVMQYEAIEKAIEHKEQEICRLEALRDRELESEVEMD